MSQVVTCLEYPAPGRAASLLLVMLPGAGMAADEFAAHGMVAAVRALGLAVDIIVAQPDMALYLDDGITDALHAAVIEPARARGYARIWLLGISLGGMGALLYAGAHPDVLEGIVLLAPFLGTRGTVAELQRAGGLAAWSPHGSNATAPEQRLLRWLQGHVAARPALYVGYAWQDRFAAAHEMLAASLPPERVACIAGGHDWPSWQTLWRTLLTRAPFGLDGEAVL